MVPAISKSKYFKVILIRHTTIDFVGTIAIFKFFNNYYFFYNKEIVRKNKLEISTRLSKFSL